MNYFAARERITQANEAAYTELDQLLHNMYYRLAYRYPVVGMEPDDIAQEFRIKVWDTVAQGKYDPDKVKPSTFFFTVLTRHALNLQRSMRAMKRADDFLTRSTHSLDFDWLHSDGESEQLWSESQEALSVPFDHYFCDRCQAIVDPHTPYAVTIEPKLEIICALCTQMAVYYEVDNLPSDAPHTVYSP